MSTAERTETRVAEHQQGGVVNETPRGTTESATRGAWRIVMQREILVKLRDRGFLISTVLMVAAIAISFTVSGFITNRTTTVTVAATGPGAAQVVQAAGSLAEAAHKKVAFTAQTVADQAAVEQRVRAGSSDVGLLPTASGGWRLVGKTTKDDNAEIYFTAAVTQLTMQRNAIAAGTSIAALSRGSAVSYSLLESSPLDPSLAKFVGLIFAILFYISAMLFGMSIAQSVVEEKQNRIVEILASAIPLRQLLIGKVVGNTIMALAQVVVLAAVGLIGLTALGHSSEVGQIAGAAGWFIVFFVVGFLALAGLYAVAGALATRSEDLQSTATPMIMVVLLILFLGIFLTGTARVVASYVPFASIVTMPGRVADGSAAWWEPVPSLLVMAATTCGIVLVAEKVYRRSLMQTGKRLTIRQALRVED
ncbi:ABC transporter permease [Nocardia alni]|uniref:ABC transporter permease n=1 Tax=Nocardia alni TaxID=2815723 RepID=UPI0027E14760|nr:ABC transporter permease [Nocardia alni]